MKQITQHFLAVESPTFSKMDQEQVAAAVIIALIFQKNKSRKKRQKRKVYVKLCLERKKSLGFFETLLPELRLEDEYNYEKYLRITSEIFQEISQLIKDDTTKGTLK